MNVPKMSRKGDEEEAQGEVPALKKRKRKKKGGCLAYRSP